MSYIKAAFRGGDVHPHKPYFVLSVVRRNPEGAQLFEVQFKPGFVFSWVLWKNKNPRPQQGACFYFCWFSSFVRHERFWLKITAALPASHLRSQAPKALVTYPNMRAQGAETEREKQ